MALSLWGCAPTPQQSGQTTATEPVTLAQEPFQESISLALPPSEFDAQFDLAEQSLIRFDWMQASVALQALPQDRLTLPDAAYLDYLQARIAYLRGNQELALQQIAAHENELLSPALSYRRLSFEHHMLALQAEHIGAGKVAHQLQQMAPRDLKADWKRSVWLNLQRADQKQLRAALLQAQDPLWHGWLELALIARTNSYTLSHGLTQWRDTYLEHPAADPLPGGLEYSLQTRSTPSRVALMLPLEGRLAAAGRAVLDGYLAAHFQARATGNAAFDLMIIDTSLYDSAQQAYAEAVLNQAQLVVGPLSKKGVAELAGLPDRPVPVLALNRVESVPPASGAALVQLALSPEDEAVRIAELAYGRGARSALLIRPSNPGTDTLASALGDRWRSLGGQIVARAQYSKREEQASSLKAALGLTASDQRARQLGSLFNTNFEFTARRRQDPDVVFLLASNETEARAIKPLLAFLYAGELPVFSVSRIYSGVPNEANRELNGINLVETPWLLGTDTALRVAIAAGGTSRGIYTRLNALGADAFLLQSEFGRLGSGADALLRGNTGLLTMDPQQRIRRELSPATFDGGELIPQ